VATRQKPNCLTCFFSARTSEAGDPVSESIVNSQADWDKLGGANCPRCGQDAIRFRPEDGVCIHCAQALNEKELRDERKRARFLRFMKAHNARIDRNKRRRGVQQHHDKVWEGSGQSSETG